MRLGKLSIYIEPRDLWWGAYIAPHAAYCCPLPTLVFRWTRKVVPPQLRAIEVREAIVEAVDTVLRQAEWPPPDQDDPHEPRRDVEKRVAALEDVLAAVYLYVDWQYVTRQLTTEQKELWADAIETSSARLDGAETAMTVDRWWAR